MKFSAIDREISEAKDEADDAEDLIGSPNWLEGIETARSGHHELEC